MASLASVSLSVKWSLSDSLLLHSVVLSLCPASMGLETPGQLCVASDSPMLFLWGPRATYTSSGYRLRQGLKQHCSGLCLALPCPSRHTHSHCPALQHTLVILDRRNTRSFQPGAGMSRLAKSLLLAHTRHEWDPGLVAKPSAYSRPFCLFHPPPLLALPTPHPAWALSFAHDPCFHCCPTLVLWLRESGEVRLKPLSLPHPHPTRNKALLL